MTRSDDIDDLLDSFSEDEMIYDCEEDEPEISACERCDMPATSPLYEINDVDPATGYSAVIWVCADCLKDKR